MASVTKRGIVWQYAVSNYVDGKSRPIRKSGFRTKKEAEIAAAEVELGLRNGVVFHGDKTPFNDYFDKWVKLYKKDKISIMTMKHYTYTSNLIKGFFNDKYITQIDRKEYQAFLNHIGSTRAKETVAKVNTHIKSCVADALEDKIISADFTRKTELTWKVEAKKEEEKYLNYEEYEMLLNGVVSRLSVSNVYYILLIALTSGMRFGEIVGLTSKDIDFVNNKINVDKTWGYKPGGTFGFGPTKNKQSTRKIKIDKVTMGYLKNYIDNMKVNEFDLLFYSEVSKHKCISNSAANDVLRNVTHDLKLDRITMHALRHTHASSLLYKKASVYYVSERLGHQDIETTLKEYTHVLKELREEDERLSTSILENMYENKYVQSDVQSDA